MTDEPGWETRYCAYCPKLCRFSCPVAVAESSETSTPWGRQTLFYLVEKGFRPFDVETASLFHHCAFCMACFEYCDHDVVIPDVMRKARRQAVDLKLISRDTRNLKRNFTHFGSLHKTDLKKNLDHYVPEEYKVNDAEVLYFPGCDLVANSPKTLASIIKLLKFFEIDFVGVMTEPPFCCGEPLDVLGFADEFEKHAGKFWKNIKHAKKVICHSPECLVEFLERYPALGFKSRTEFVHVTEFFSPYVADVNKPVHPVEGKIFYHDPCYLGRKLNIFEAPRRILEKICRNGFQEFHWHKRDAICCGYGSRLSFTVPETAAAIAERRFREFKVRKGDILVTACPECTRAFNNVDGKEGRVKDIMDVLSEALGA